MTIGLSAEIIDAEGRSLAARCLAAPPENAVNIPARLGTGNTSCLHSISILRLIPWKMFTIRGTRLMLPPHTASCVRLSSTSSALPPPRRKCTTGSVFLPPASSSSSPSSASITPSTNANILERPAVSGTNTSFTASLSQMTKTSAVLAGTAFFIATSLVGLSAYGVVWGTKMGLGVDDAHQFGLRMRSALSLDTPSHTSSIGPSDTVSAKGIRAA
ncbi:hypothetical protein D9613_012797 [Agrocybe pediades]|uniref:Uncharacterized protein n=1 Tax=Agrocybe pediades TaxID=84607 RepID=A0A8H4R4K6_9AGAR|nr:hypothetical protein D9613_012797 [Agrocybe pediades]